MVYANTNTGIRNAGSYSSSYTSRILSNTLYQSVGDAIVLSGSDPKVVENNIVRVDAGYALNVASSAQSAVRANYNLFSLSTDPNARIGLWGSTQAATLPAWRTVSGQDAASVSGDPLFVDMNGADDVLGYTTAGSGYDGGRDDNFSVRRLSPAIDAANAATAPSTDRYGQARVDDPGTANAGGSIADLGAVEFLGSSLDTAPPTVTATFPVQIASGGAYGVTTRIDITFSEGTNAIDALARGNYELVKAGSGGFGSANDVYYTLSPAALSTVAAGVLSVRLDLGLTGASLPNGQYRLTVRGSASRAISDSAGNKLDGNADGSAGGDWVRTFTVDQSIEVTPRVTVTGSLAGVITTYGTASGTSSIAVTGSNLTAAITAAAPAGFEVSSDGTTFSTTATFTPTGVAVSGTLYVRLAATTNAGTYAGDVTLSSTGATNVTAAMPSSTVSQKALTITGLAAAAKTYDGTTAASLSGTAALFGV
ncbi:MAG: hypothetical protein EBZ59_12310, partial [Planctomycetia bacterium]|nr:hypothetical protein [Planctomycetia bacterium]